MLCRVLIRLRLRAKLQQKKCRSLGRLDSQLRQIADFRTRSKSRHINATEGVVSQREQLVDRPHHIAHSRSKQRQ
eukprot:scaffold11933_cov117-Skeletonema_dohrnii-CCMP3373.AAC.3